MTTFAISDLHGYPVDKFKALLDKANFSDSDTLYILGDVIDRSGGCSQGFPPVLLRLEDLEVFYGD